MPGGQTSSLNESERATTKSDFPSTRPVDHIRGAQVRLRIPNRRVRDLGRRMPRSAVPVTVGRSAYGSRRRRRKTRETRADEGAQLGGRIGGLDPGTTLRHSTHRLFDDLSQSGDHTTR